jgi:MFS family permease
VQWVLVGARIGGLLAMLIAALADRRGRKIILLAALWAAVLFTATGAFAPNLVMLGISQTVARSFSAAVALIIAIMAAEEMPAGSRAFAVSVLTMSGALGAGGVIIFLGLADLAPGAWRGFYLVPLLWIPLLLMLGRHLTETRRFEVYEVADSPVEQSAQARRTGWQRFALIGATSFLFALFFTPASGNLNEFLRTEQGYSGLQISLLQVITNLPGGLAIVVGGRLADSRGRRVIGAIGVAGGVGFTVLMYLSTGAGIWVFSAAATLVGAMAVPALGVYGPELFPTSSRGLANGGLNLLGVAGSVVGLLVVGRLADRWGTFSTPMAVLGIGPAIIVLLVLFLYPETAHRELEDLNPDDISPPHDPAALDALDDEFIEHELEHGHHVGPQHHDQGQPPAAP